MIKGLGCHSCGICKASYTYTHCRHAVEVHTAVVDTSEQQQAGRPLPRPGWGKPPHVPGRDLTEPQKRSRTDTTSQVSGAFADSRLQLLRPIEIHDWRTCLPSLHLVWQHHLISRITVLTVRWSVSATSCHISSITSFWSEDAPCVVRSARIMSCRCGQAESADWCNQRSECWHCPTAGVSCQ